MTRYTISSCCKKSAVRTFSPVSGQEARQQCREQMIICLGIYPFDFRRFSYPVSVQRVEDMKTPSSSALTDEEEEEGKGECFGTGRCGIRLIDSTRRMEKIFSQGKEFVRSLVIHSSLFTTENYNDEFSLFFSRTMARRNSSAMDYSLVILFPQRRAFWRIRLVSQTMARRNSGAMGYSPAFPFSH
jgi:hypothetical protein